MDGLLMENPIKMDDSGAPFQETSKYSFLYNPYPDFWWWESIFPLYLIIVKSWTSESLWKHGLFNDISTVSGWFRVNIPWKQRQVRCCCTLEHHHRRRAGRRWLAWPLRIALGPTQACDSAPRGSGHGLKPWNFFKWGYPKSSKPRPFWYWNPWIPWFWGSIEKIWRWDPKMNWFDHLIRTAGARDALSWSTNWPWLKVVL